MISIENLATPTEHHQDCLARARDGQDSVVLVQKLLFLLGEDIYCTLYLHSATILHSLSTWPNI